MSSTAARVAHMRNWVEQLEADIARLQVERDTLWKTIAVLDPDGKVPFGALFPTPPLPPEGANTFKIAIEPKATKPKAATKAKVSAEPKRRGRPPGRDWVEIAKHVIEFRDAGVAVAPALAKLYKVPGSTAKNWMARCREMGLVPPLVANLKVVEDNTVSLITATYDATAVAAAYLEAIRTNHRPIQAVADALEVDKATAVNWVRQARIDGVLPPAHQPQLPEADRRALLDMSKPEPVA